MELTRKEEIILESIQAVKRNEEEIVVVLSKVPRTMLQEVIDICRDKEFISIKVTPKDLVRLDEQEIFLNKEEFNSYFYCNTISEAPPKLMVRHGIREVLVGVKENPSSERMDLIKYGFIYTKLSMLVRDIDKKLPEKDRFKKVYRRLALMIDYDMRILDEESQYSKDNLRTSRNLENAVLLNKSVCLGFAETLKQTLSLVGIESKIAHSLINEEDEQHAYNVVKIDGNWYNTDLTWDYPSIRKGIRPKYCLKSDRDFQKCGILDKPSHMPDNNAIEIPECYKSLEIFPELKLRRTFLKRIKSKIIKSFIINPKNKVIPAYSTSDGKFRNEMRIYPASISEKQGNIKENYIDEKEEDKDLTK